MARGRRNKGDQSRIANSNPPGQLQDSPAPQQSKPVANSTPSSQKKRQRHQAKLKPTNEPDKPADPTGGQEQRTSQKKRSPNMLRARNNKTGPAPKAGQLPRPKGYVPPKQQPKKPHWVRGHKKPTVAMPPPSSAILPWDVDPEFPRPLANKDLHSFNYDRPWHSLREGHVREELQKHMENGRRAQLPRLFHDSTDEEMAVLREKYLMKGQSRLYEIRKENRNAPESSTPFIASSLVNNDNISLINEDSPLIKALRTAELRKIIVDNLNPSIVDITALAATCTVATACAKHDFEFWDFNSGSFPTDQYVDQERGVRTATLVISPLSDEPDRPQKPYMADFKNLMKLCAAITTIPHSFKDIILDRIPFLDVSMVEMMVNSMPKLESITITRCQLLDVTKLKPLLDVIKRRPRTVKANATGEDGPGVSSDGIAGNGSKADKATKEYIRLDFFPFFFRGPNSAKRLGSYGVTHNEPTFHTPKAVFGLILQCRDLAREVGMDLLSDSSSFFNFVRQLPGPDILWAVKARDALITREHELAAGKKDPKLTREGWADDITAALTGDDYKAGVIPHDMAKYRRADHHAKYHWRKDHKCGRCGVTYPMSLFPIRTGTCWCCKMVEYVSDMEDSHLRLWQASALRNWAGSLDPTTATLDNLLTYREPTLDKALSDVRDADWRWEHFLFSFQPESPYSPPTPEGLDGKAASLARWRSHKNPPKERFDYRKGGPQYEDPCKEQLSAGSYQDDDFGTESLESYTAHWRGSAASNRVFISHFIETYNGRRRRDPVFAANYGDITTGASDPRVQKALAAAKRSPHERAKVCRLERRMQNRGDKDVYTCHHARVEGDLLSLFTPANKPFNLDKYVLHPKVDKNEYQKIMDDFTWATVPYSSYRRC